MHNIRRLKIIEAVYAYNHKHPKEADFNRDKLAIKLKVNPANLSKLNTGYRIPTPIQDLYKVATEIGCDIEDFYEFTFVNNKKILSAVNIKKMLKSKDSEIRLLTELNKLTGVSKEKIYSWSKGVGITKSIIPFYNLCTVLEIKAVDLIEV